MKRVWKVLLLAGLSAACAIALVRPPIASHFTHPWMNAELETETIVQIARQMSVSVWDREFLGSGVAIARQDNTYTVLTNDHVLRAGTAPFFIQTADGQRHEAQAIVREADLDNNDLALLEFESEQTYAIARRGLTPETQAKVYAAGFPLQTNREDNAPTFVCRPGEVGLVLDMPFEGGYQIGYTSPVEKGMSGGAIINRRGELVGVNGMHAYPLWGDPYIYRDGSIPDPQLREQFPQYSWGILLQTFEEALETRPRSPTSFLERVVQSRAIAANSSLR